MFGKNQFVKKPLGRNMYIFHYSGNAKTADNLVISSHGCIERNNSPKFKVPSGMILHFYSNHGTPTGDKGLVRFGNSVNYHKQKKESIAQGSDCYDYILTKYQGSHNQAGETYDSIRNTQVNNETHKTEYNNTLGVRKAYYASKTRDVQRQRAQEDLQRNYKSFDVLTIRNRSRQGSMRLSEVLSGIRSYGYSYRTIHCYFCRSF